MVKAGELDHRRAVAPLPHTALLECRWVHPAMANPKLVHTLDPRTIRLDAILEQAMDKDARRAAGAWGFLASIARDRPEAEVFLIGLMQLHHGDLTRMTGLISSMSIVRTEAAGRALVQEFLTTPSTRATKSYLNQLFNIFTTLNPEFRPQLLSIMADDKRLSAKWRKRFHDLIGELGG